MVTNDERRDVARRLRDYTAKDLRYSDPICELVCSSEIDCIGFDSCGGSDMMPECVKLVFDRLADLIEPSEPKVKCIAEVKVDGERLDELVHDAAVELTGIDRDALLELADECGDASRAYGGDGHELTSMQFANVARRIREALGVDDA